MDVLKIPVDPKLPVLFCGVPVLRFIIVVVVACVIHAAVSWLLLIGMMNFGFASVNGNRFDKTMSGLCLDAYYCWNFGYFIFWPPTQDHPFAGKHLVVIPWWTGTFSFLIGLLDVVRWKRRRRNPDKTAVEKQSARSS